MKASCLQENLNNALNIVKPALPIKAVMPVTENILIRTGMGVIELIATDLEMTIITRISAKVEENGELIVPGKIFSSSIENFAQDRVDLYTKPNSQSFYADCAKNKVRISCFAVNNYPVIPEVTGNKIEFIASDFLKIINSISFSAATDSSRPILQGIGIRSFDDYLNFAASDGFRLSLFKYEYLGEPIDITVPAKNLLGIRSMLTDPEEKIIMEISTSRVSFRTRNSQMISQNIQGVFPKYNSLIPAGFETKTVVSASELLRAVKSANIFTDSSSIVKINITKDKVKITGQSEEVGDSENEIDITLKGEENKISLKAKQLIDFLTVFKEEKVNLKMNNGSSPFLISPVDNENCIYLIMPMITQ